MRKQHSRRKFLQTAALTTAALPLAAGTGTPVDRAAMDEKVIIGHGDFKYKVDKGWGDLDPTGQPIIHCHEMVLDTRGRLICSAVSGKFDALVYNKDGKLLTSFQHNLVEPHGMSFAGEGNDQTLWLTDPETGRVLNLDLDGRIIRELTVPADQVPEGKQFKPTETAVAANGDIYIADGYGTNKIFQYDDKGQLKNVFGGPDHFDCCHGIVVDTRSGEEELLITSRAANNFQRWTMDGHHISTRVLPGLSICRPVISGENTYFAVIVTKSWYHYDGMVAVLDRNMDVVSLPGGTSPRQQDDFTEVKPLVNMFMNPHDVCVDDDGDLYVPQWYSGRTYPIRLKRV